MLNSLLSCISSYTFFVLDKTHTLRLLLEYFMRIHLWIAFLTFVQCYNWTHTHIHKHSFPSFLLQFHIHLFCCCCFTKGKSLLNVFSPSEEKKREKKTAPTFPFIVIFHVFFGGEQSLVLQNLFLSFPADFWIFKRLSPLLHCIQVSKHKHNHSLFRLYTKEAIFRPIKNGGKRNIIIFSSSLFLCVCRLLLASKRILHCITSCSWKEHQISV